MVLLAVGIAEGAETVLTSKTYALDEKVFDVRQPQSIDRTQVIDGLKFGILVEPSVDRTDPVWPVAIETVKIFSGLTSGTPQWTLWPVGAGLFHNDHDLAYVEVEGRKYCTTVHLREVAYVGQRKTGGVPRVPTPERNAGRTGEN